MQTSQTHNIFYLFIFLISNAEECRSQNDPISPRILWYMWIMTITPPARPYAHLTAQVFSYATPQLIKASMQLQSNASRRFPPPGPPQLIFNVAKTQPKSSKEPKKRPQPSSCRLLKGRSTLITQRIQPSGFVAFCLKARLVESGHRQSVTDYKSWPQLKENLFVFFKEEDNL